jgi:hypothetical protein
MLLFYETAELADFSYCIHFCKIISRKETYRPPEFVTKPTNQVVHEGKKLRTVSKVTGIPPPQICWFKEGKPIRQSDDSRVKIYDDDGLSYFELENTSILDAGEYTCTASNVMGAVFSPINVVIEAMTEPENSDMYYSDVEKSANDNANESKSDTTDAAVPKTVIL